MGAGRPEASSAIEAARVGKPVVVGVGMSAKKKRATEWKSGMTLMNVLVVTFPEHTNFPYHLTMRRLGKESYVDVESIANGEQPDIEIEPGDEIFIAEDLPFR